MNFNLNSMCIRSIHEYNDLTRQVETVRTQMSYYNFTNDSESSNAFTLLKLTKISLYILFIILAIVGNSFLILVISLNNFMKKPTNYFILNLAFCDLAIVFSCMWVQIVQIMNKYWTLGKYFCKFNTFFQMVSVIASVLTLASISCDRYFGIAYPFKVILTKKRTFCILVSIWIFSILISIPSFIYRTYTERKWADFTETQCDDIGWPTTLVYNSDGCAIKKVQSIKRIYYTTVILLLFFIPILIMSITYSFLIYKLSKKEVIGESNSEEKRTDLERRKKVIFMLVWILATFFVCWSPLETMLLLMEYSSMFPAWWSSLEWISYFMAYSNTAINPLIYAGLSKNYRLGYKRIRSRLIKRNRSISNNLTIRSNNSFSCKFKKKNLSVAKIEFDKSQSLINSL